MLRKIFLPLALVSCLLILPNVQKAQAVETLVKGAPAQVFPMRPAQQQQSISEGLLIVRDVIVDKTAKNVMLAREEAISDARRQAFMKLAERNMTPDEFRVFKAPDDKTLAILTHDFEINSEKLSTTRYVASFTVRFRDAVRSYINIIDPVRPAAAQMSAEETPENVPAAEVEKSSVLKETAAQTFLILPYFETPGGKTVLWEDPNPWRVAWQRDAHLVSGSGISFVVPMGDINDIAAGEADAVWSGNYKAIEKLSQTYGTDQAVLSVAGKSGSYMTIDMYFFRDGRLTKREVLQPFVGGKSEVEALHQAMREVIRFLQNPPVVENAAQEPAANISRSLVSEAKTTVVTMRDAGMEFEAAARFDNPETWMDLQRRLSSLSPSLKVDIRALSSNGAQFTMRYDGDVQALRSALLQKGIMMEAPAVEVNPSVLVSGVPAQKYIYGLHLMN